MAPRFVDDKNDIDEFLKELSRLVPGEIGELEKLSAIGQQVEEKLSEIYREKFPKTCNTCGLIFMTREEYIMATNPTQKNGVRWDKIVDKVQEYRNCVCGSTLMLMVPDRRDMSEFGIERRRLFTEFVNKITQITNEEKVIIEGRVRDIFRRLAKKAAAG